MPDCIQYCLSNTDYYQEENLAVDDPNVESEIVGLLTDALDNLDASDRQYEHLGLAD